MIKIIVFNHEKNRWECIEVDGHKPNTTTV